MDIVYKFRKGVMQSAKKSFKVRIDEKGTPKINKNLIKSMYEYSRTSVKSFCGVTEDLM
jgi:hypothetical protein